MRLLLASVVVPTCMMLLFAGLPEHVQAAANSPPVLRVEGPDGNVVGFSMADLLRMKRAAVQVGSNKTQYGSSAEFVGRFRGVRA